MNKQNKRAYKVTRQANARNYSLALAWRDAVSAKYHETFVCGQASNTPFVKYHFVRKKEI